MKTSPAQRRPLEWEEAQNPAHLGPKRRRRTRRSQCPPRLAKRGKKRIKPWQNKAFGKGRRTTATRGQLLQYPRQDSNLRLAV